MKVQRSTLLHINPIFTAHLLNYQDSKHNPRTSLFKEGQEVFLKYDKKAVCLTKEQAATLNQEDLDYFNEHKDVDPFKTNAIYPFVSEKALVSSKKNKKVFLNDIGETLEALRSELQQKHLIVLGDWPTPWLQQNNDYAPVKVALNYLKTKILSSFTGGFQLKQKELIDFIPHLFWLTRCNASLPCFMMTFETSKTVFSLCKYGILHVDFYDKKEQEFILNFFSDRKFLEVEYCSDTIDFDI